jgi:glycosyltransferase involved in cell wall biosynthesis
MMKILFITAFKPSRLSAGENFSRLLLYNLSLDHQLDLVYFKNENDTTFEVERANIQIIKEYNLNKWVKLFTYLTNPFNFPVFGVRFNKKRKQEIKEILDKKTYDLVFLDYGQCFEVGLQITKSKILIAHDVFYQRYNRHNIFLGYWSRFTERKLLQQSNAQIFTFSEKDQRLIFDNYKLESNVTGFFLDELVISAKPKQIENYFVFFARWGRKDNSEGLEWFFDNVYPLLEENITFKIIGAELDLKLEKKIQRKNVEILGFINDPYSIIADAKALIAPLFNGAGVKVKVVEALACGTPVIGSEISFEGIDTQFSKFMFQCKSPLDYIDKIHNISIPLETRQSFKNNFVSKNNAVNILNYVNAKQI